MLEEWGGGTSSHGCLYQWTSGIHTTPTQKKPTTAALIRQSTEKTSMLVSHKIKVHQVLQRYTICSGGNKLWKPRECSLFLCVIIGQILLFTRIGFTSKSAHQIFAAHSYSPSFFLMNENIYLFFCLMLTYSCIQHELQHGAHGRRSPKIVHLCQHMQNRRT